MITLNPTSDSNKSRRISSSQNGGRVRDVSFSSFLDGTEETFILKLAESEDNLKSHNPNCLDRNHNYLASKKAEDNKEIDVFNAEKYFNGRVEDADESHGFDSKKAIDQNTNINPPELEFYKSSLNSRSSLLLDDIPQTQQSHKSNRWSLIKCRKIIFSKLGCSCNDKNSVAVDIDVQVQMARISSSSCSGRKPAKAEDFPMKIELQTKVGGDPRNIEDFRFPVMKSNRGAEEDDDDDGARKLLEVFGNMSGLSVERRLKMLTWDDGIDIKIPSKSSRLYYNNNVDSDDSDASSDLFEIESLSTNPSSSQYLTTQTSESDAPSIDRNVVPAAISAADLAATSDSEERTRLNSEDYDTDGGRGKTRRHSSILSSCYNNKAVMVAGDAHRTTTGDQQVSSHSKAALETREM